MGRLFSNDPITRSKEVFHYDKQDDTFVIDHVQDTTAVLDANKAEANQRGGRYGDGLVHKVASIPLVVWQDLERRGIAGDDKALKRWLDDPENRFFKTRHGRLS